MPLESFFSVPNRRRQHQPTKLCATGLPLDTPFVKRLITRYEALLFLEALKHRFVPLPHGIKTLTMLKLVILFADEIFNTTTDETYNLTLYPRCAIRDPSDHPAPRCTFQVRYPSPN